VEVIYKVVKLMKTKAVIKIMSMSLARILEVMHQDNILIIVKSKKPAIGVLLVREVLQTEEQICLYEVAMISI
jgi:hypothetical protein